MFGLDADMIFRIPALLIALTFHEYAHARAAVSLGDPTPRYDGRLTLNPLPHLDPIGLIMLWLFSFGWAKPVIINPFNLRDSKHGMLLVSLAGPAMNIGLALVSMFILAAVGKIGGLPIELEKVLIYIYKFNLVLAVFNLIPLPPLDGSQIVSSLLPGRQAEVFERIAPYGPFILIGLVYVGLIGTITGPATRLLHGLITAIVYAIF